MASRKMGILACVGAVLLLVLALVMAAGQPAHSAPEPEAPTVSDAWIRLPVVAGRPAAAYFTLMGGRGADRLLGVEARAPIRAEMHETIRNGGAMSMAPLKILPVAAKAHLMFAPGGRHVMLFGLPKTAKPGDMIPLTLKFERAGMVRIDAVARSGIDAGAHSHH